MVGWFEPAGRELPWGICAGLHIAALALKKHREERLRWEREWAARERRAEAERRRQAELNRKAEVISEAANGWQTSNRIRDFALTVSKAGESYECSSSRGRLSTNPRK